jgi:hypothetical protein
MGTSSVQRHKVSMRQQLRCRGPHALLSGNVYAGIRLVSSPSPRGMSAVSLTHIVKFHLSKRAGMQCL